MENIKYILIRDVHKPTRGTEEAAGIDFYVPEYNESFLKDLIEKNAGNASKIDYFVENVLTDKKRLGMRLKPQGRILIPSGVKTYLEPGTALIAANKSGIASKYGLVFGAQVVDSDYTGEIHISIINTSDEPYLIFTGDKLIQFIHTPVLLSSLDEVTKEEYNKLHENSQRGSGGFGSTGIR